VAGRAFLPEARGASAAAVVDGKIVVVGGVGMENKHVDSIAIYDPATDSWRHAHRFHAPRSSHGGAVGGIV